MTSSLREHDIGRSSARPSAGRCRVPGWLALAPLVLALTIAGCGGGSGGGGSGGASAGSGLRGTVPDNRRLASQQLEIRAASGERSVATIESDGRFAVEQLTGTGPWMLRATFGVDESWYAITHSADKVANVHAYSDLAVRNVLASAGQSVEALFDQEGALAADMLPTEPEVTAVNTAVGDFLAPSLEAYGLAGLQLATAEFAANGQGLDAFLTANPALVEKADLIIISSDGGTRHALYDKEDPTKHMKHLDGVLKKTGAGLIVIHWATDAPSPAFGKLQPENAAMMMDWIGAVYYWVQKGKDPKSSWTWKYPVLEMTVNQEHPISNGVPETFQLQDEYYFNFFTDADGRNPGSDRVTFLHSAHAPSHRDDMANKENWRDQACYWAFTRENGGRSVAMTSAHMYHTWANPHFFQSFTNSVFWTLNLEIPDDGVEIATPTVAELLSLGDTEIYKMARHFK